MVSEPYLAFEVDEHHRAFRRIVFLQQSIKSSRAYHFMMLVGLPFSLFLGLAFAAATSFPIDLISMMAQRKSFYMIQLSEINHVMVFEWLIPEHQETIAVANLAWQQVSRSSSSTLLC